MIRTLQSWFYRHAYDPVAYFFYRHFYAPIGSALDDYRHRNDPPLPPVPCQLCGRPGHKEAFCPNAKVLGFFDG